MPPKLVAPTPNARNSRSNPPTTLVDPSDYSQLQTPRRPPRRNNAGNGPAGQGGQGAAAAAAAAGPPASQLPQAVAAPLPAPVAPPQAAPQPNPNPPQPWLAQNPQQAYAFPAPQAPPLLPPAVGNVFGHVPNIQAAAADHQGFQQAQGPPPPPPPPFQSGQHAAAALAANAVIPTIEVVDPTHGLDIGGDNAGHDQAGVAADGNDESDTESEDSNRSHVSSADGAQSEVGDERFVTPATGNDNGENGGRPGPQGSPVPGARVGSPRRPGSRDSFWRIFKNQVNAAGGHMETKPAILSGVIGCLLILSQICSAGRLCHGEGDVWRFYSIWKAAISIPARYAATYLCLFCVNTLTILGVCDLVTGNLRVLRKFGRSKAAVQQPEFNLWSRHFRSIGYFCKLCCNETTEPFLILVLMFALKDIGIFSDPRLFEKVSDPVRLFCISGTLHLVKWFLQAVEIFHDLSSERHLQKPAVFGFLVILTMCTVIGLHGGTIMEDIVIGRTYFGIQCLPFGAMVSFFLKRRIQRLGQNMGINMARVTDTVVTEWVKPTDMAY